MAWSTEVKLWLLNNVAWPKAQARLIDHEVFEGVPIDDLIKEEVEVATAATWQLAFAQGPSWPSDPAGTLHYIALTIEDDPKAGFNGLWFRTTALEQLPAGTPGDPNGYIEIVLSGPIFTVVTAREPVPASVPAEPKPLVLEEAIAEHLPIRLNGSNEPIPPSDTSTPVVSTIEKVTLTPEAGGPVIVAVFTGVTRQGPGGASVEFKLTIPLALGPTEYPLELKSVVEVQVALGRSASLEVTPTTSTFDSSLKAALAEAFSGMILASLVPEVTSELAAAISAAALEQGAALFGSGHKELPAGVVLSCRDLVVSGNEIVIHVALGAFGGVLNRFPKASGSLSCPVTMLALAYPTLLNLAALRRARIALAALPAGQELIDVYDRNREELVRVLADDRALAQDTAQWLSLAQTALLDDPSLAASAYARAISLWQRFAHAASPPLQADLEALEGRLTASA